MSKKWGILYHHGGRLRKDKGWSEKESDNPPDKFWEGEIDNKLPNGFGTYTLRNGEFYIITVVDCVKTKVGLKKNLTIHPISFGKVRLTTNYRMVSGHITHTNGTTYVGYYRDGLREGKGTWTLYDEINFVGIWKDNRKRKGKSFDEEGKEIGEYVNGEEEIYFKPSF